MFSYMAAPETERNVSPLHLHRHVLFVISAASNKISSVHSQYLDLINALNRFSLD